MPTPSDDNPLAGSSAHATCPPDDDRSSWGDAEMEEVHRSSSSSTPDIRQEPTPPRTDAQIPVASTHISDQLVHKRMELEEESGIEMLTPTSTEVDSSRADKHTDVELSAIVVNDTASPPIGYDFSNIRLIPLISSSFMRAGSKFKGTQQSERQRYKLDVEIKYVDMRESFLCGYLKIQGLTEDHPTLTTYFDGEIIGSKYSFLTRHDDWGTSDKVDLQHWAKFNAFRPFQKMARKHNIHIPNWTQRENIFMRWKERFLVPDHRVEAITGASFAGFYYICFNQIHGTVSGIYFHAMSERFQRLELKHVEDRGCAPAMEFR